MLLHIGVVVGALAIFYYFKLSATVLAAPHNPATTGLPYPSPDELLKYDEGGRYHKRSSDGLNLEYFSLFGASPSQSRAKTAVVFFHPSWSTGKTPCRFKFSAVVPILDMFADTDHALICPSMPGWGASEPYSQSTSPAEAHKNFAQDTADLLTSLGYSQVYLVGWEFGAYNAHQLASFLLSSSASLTVSGLVAVSPPSLLPSGPSQVQPHNSGPSFLSHLPLVPALLRISQLSNIDNNLFTHYYPEFLGEAFRALKQTHSSEQALLAADSKRVFKYRLFSQLVDMFPPENFSAGSIPDLKTHVYCPLNDAACADVYANEWKRTAATTAATKFIKYDTPSSLGIPIEQIVFNLLREDSDEVAETANNDGGGFNAQATAIPRTKRNVVM
jgi:pimeloyl-ACP methyl ester carboxylesterase